MNKRAPSKRALLLFEQIKINKSIHTLEKLFKKCAIDGREPKKNEEQQKVNIEEQNRRTTSVNRKRKTIRTLVKS